MMNHINSYAQKLDDKYRAFTVGQLEELDLHVHLSVRMISSREIDLASQLLRKLPLVNSKNLSSTQGCGSYLGKFFTLFSFSIFDFGKN